ncbi:beta strand repeat-containing protein, partial [Neptunomonas sp.]|uniref:beta strand repeat-containing protein n=1 Tax=Neptunomonas sp. TaxID=1971898 RepID=UPI003563EE96
MTVHGEALTYTVDAGDDLADIAEELQAMVTSVSASALGNKIILTDLQGSSVAIDRGDGSVDALFDLDFAKSKVWGYAYDNGDGTYTDYRLKSTHNLEVFYKDLAGNVSNLSQIPVPTQQDQGSDTQNPFVSYSFDKAGTYYAKVSSSNEWMDKTLGFTDFAGGVWAGMDYQLNMSVENHAFNQHAVSLVGKTLTITDGLGFDHVQGQGQSSKIVGYDGATGVYQLENTAITLDATSIYDISYLMTEEFNTYNTKGEGDTFNVLLQSEPAVGEVVRVDLLPQVTPTYNAQYAFNETQNNGEHNNVQVEVAARKLAIAFATDLVAGSTWSFMLQDEVVTGTVPTDTSTLAAGVRVAIETIKENSLSVYSVVIEDDGNGSDVLHVSMATGTDTFLATAASSGITLTPYAEFTQDNWNSPQTVYVTAVDDDIADGSDAQVFAGLDQRINKIRGPLTINGGVRSDADRYLNNPFMLPGETNWYEPDGTITDAARIDAGNNMAKATLTHTGVTHVDPLAGEKNGFDTRLNDFSYEFYVISGDAAGTVMQVESVSGDTVTFTEDWPEGKQPVAGDEYYYRPVNLNQRVIEADQVDVLNLFNGNDPTNSSGTLTSTHISGFGMSDEAVIGDKKLVGGIHYSDLEEISFELGLADNDLTIESTHTGITRIIGGEGVDEVTAKTISGLTIIELGEGNDKLIVSNDQQQVDQIAALLAFDGGADQDTVEIDDRGDIDNADGYLTDKSVTGLDMPSSAEIQTLKVQGGSGSYTLKLDGYGIESGLAASTHIERHEGFALIRFDLTASGDAIAALLNNALGVSSGVSALERDGVYTLTFGGDLAGMDIAQLQWAYKVDVANNTPVVLTYQQSINDIAAVVAAALEADVADVSVRRDMNGLIEVSFSGALAGKQTLIWDQRSAVQTGLTPAVEASANVRVTTLAEGGMVQSDSHVQLLTLSNLAVGSTYTLSVLGETTAPIAHNASVDDLLAALNPILNPNNTDQDLPHTDNVSVFALGGDIAIILKGEHIDAEITAASTSQTGEITLVTRAAGINYYNSEILNVRLGDQKDSFNVRSSAANTQTNIYTGKGDDAIYVGSDVDSDLILGETVVAHGILAGIKGELNLYAGDDSNELYVSDFDNTVGVTTGVITENSITGFSDGTINYSATGDFDNGLGIWTGKGGDIVEVSSVITDSTNQTVTTLYTNDGEDIITITANDDLITPAHNALPTGERRIDILGQAGDDIIDASQADLAIRVRAGDGDDQVTGGDGDDQIFGQLGQDTLDGGAGNDVLAGDTVSDISGILPAAEWIDVIRGGIGDDDIFGGRGDDILFGDSGRVLDSNGQELLASQVAQMVKIVSSDTVAGGKDKVDGEEGADRIMGGLGDDEITDLSGDNLLIGDLGTIDYSSGNINIQATGLLGGNDKIFLADGNVTALGGLGNDRIELAATIQSTLIEQQAYRRVIMGDEGSVTYRNNAAGEEQLDVMSTTTVGGNDSIELNAAHGDDLNIIVAGTNGAGIDNVTTTGNSTDIVLGDNGKISWTNEKLTLIASTDTAEGGTDEITLGNGSKTVIAGMGSDSVTTGSSGIHRVIGDNGSITYAAGALRNISSIDDLNGGQDEISLSGDINQVIGGSDNDIITVSLAVTTASSTDHILGDNGTMNYSGAIGAEQLTNLQSTINQSTLNQAGDDIITLGSGDKVVIAGKGNDTVKTTLSSVGNRTVLGDEGQLDYDANHILKSAKSTSTDGGDDILTLGGASSTDQNIVIGGVGALDRITSGDSTDIVLGDNGAITWTDGILDSIRSTDTAEGGADKITLGNGSKTVIAGTGDDTVTSGASSSTISGIHRVIGDNGSITYAAGALRNISSIDDLNGGQDAISLSGDINQVIGGCDNDIITVSLAVTTASSTDHILGDNGTMNYSGAIGAEQLTNLQSTINQ